MTTNAAVNNGWVSNQPDNILQKETVVVGDTTVEVDPNAIEPKDYFKVLKGKLQHAKDDQLQNQLDVIAQQLVAANRIGQKKFLYQLAFTHKALVAEQKLLTHGVTQFVYKDDVKEFIDKVTPKNSVKIIELQRFPRAIPLDVQKRIEDVKNLNLFDDFLVVFTDFTGSDHKDKEEQKVIARNRDPIVFGIFFNEKTGLKHDRFYFVADWEDEYCDLTFSKMIAKMADMKINDNAAHVITTNHDYIQDLVMVALQEMEERGKSGRFIDDLEDRISTYRDSLATKIKELEEETLVEKIFRKTKKAVGLK